MTVSPNEGAPHPPSRAFASLDRVWDALDDLGLRPQKARGARDFMAYNPLFDERTPSLHVTWKNGATLLHLMSAPDTPIDDLLDALGLRKSDLFDEPLQRSNAPRSSRSPRQRRAATGRKKSGRPPKRLTAPEKINPSDLSWEQTNTYHYFNAEGTETQRVYRLEAYDSEGARHKSFKQEFWSGTEWVTSKPIDFDAVLYRHPQVLEALDSRTPIWCLEGEKDVETAEAIGLVATTNTQGAGSFPESLLPIFADADVRIVIDRDIAGYKRGVTLHQQFLSRGANVTLLLPRVEDSKADFTDHVEAGFGAEDFLPISPKHLSLLWNAAEFHELVSKIQTALDEAHARTDAAEANPKKVEEHKKAVAWWAADTGRKFEQVTDDYSNLQKLVTGLDDVDEIIRGIDQDLTTAKVATRSAHELAGLPVPADTDPSAQETGSADAETPTTESDEEEITQPVELTQVRTERRRSALDAIPEGGPRYELDNGAIYKVTYKPTDEGDFSKTKKLIINLDVRVVSVEAPAAEIVAGASADPDSDHDTAAIEDYVPVTHFVFEYVHPVTGEKYLKRVTLDDARESIWIEGLALPGVTYSSTKNGRAEIWDAIKAVSGIWDHRSIYQSTGWHEIDGHGIGFVHAGGAITAAGPVEIPTNLHSSLGRYSLTTPTTEGPELRRALGRGGAGGMLKNLPPRIAAPLLGQVFGSVFGPMDYSLVLVGLPGSRKTGVATLAMHHFGTSWERKTPTLSLTGIGDTATVARFKTMHARDTCLFADDVTPSVDGQAAAEKAMGRFIRSIFGAVARDRADRTGQKISSSLPPHTSAIISSEIPPANFSDERRAFSVPIDANDTELDNIITLDRTEAREDRNLLMSSFVQWIVANDLHQKQREFAERSAHLEATFRERQVSDDIAAATGRLAAAWEAFLEFLTDTGTITDAEADQTAQLVFSALTTASAAAVDPDAPMRTGARIRSLLVTWFEGGHGHVEAIEGGCPSEHYRRLGWRRPTRGGYDNEPAPLEPLGRHHGYVAIRQDGTSELLLPERQLGVILKAALSLVPEMISVDERTARRALYNEGYLKAEERKGTTPRFTLVRNIPALNSRRRFAVLDLDRLLGDEPGDEDPQTMLPLDGGPTPNEILSFSDPTPSAPTAATSEETTEEVDGMDPSLAVQMVFADIEGHEATPTSGETESCLRCQEPTVLRFDREFPLHVLCWQDSTKQRREAAMTARMPAPPKPPVPESAPEKPKRSAGVSPRPTSQIPAAVLHTDGLYLPGGIHHAVSDINTIGDVAQLALDHGLGYDYDDYHHYEGQVWITDAAAKELGVPIEAIDDVRPARRTQAFKEATKGIRFLNTTDWSLGGDPESITGWTRLWPTTATDRSQRVMVVVSALVDHTLELLADDPAPGELADRLQRIADALHRPFSHGASVTGIDLLKATRARSKSLELFTPHPTPEPLEKANLEVDFSWSRTPTEDESSMTYVHAYDRSGSYLSVTPGLEFGYGRPFHAKSPVFDSKIPGIWRITGVDSSDWRIPHPLNPPKHTQDDGTFWVTTPTLEIAHDLGIDPQIHEAWIWEDHLRILKSWYEILRDARNNAKDPAHPDLVVSDMVKRIYTTTFGTFASRKHSTKDGYAPERWFSIVAKARANILRKINSIGTETGIWPVAVGTDTIVYTSNDPNPVSAWPGKPSDLGVKLGQLTCEKSGLLADHRPHLTGGKWEGKDELIDHAEWMEGMK